MGSLKAIGYFWFDTVQQRPFYSEREITSGRDAGKLELECMFGGKLQKITVDRTDIICRFADGGVKWIHPKKT